MEKFLTLLVLQFVSTFTFANVLPDHESLRILIVSDEVNPHDLADNELTQPGDLSTALTNTISLNTTTITEIATNQIELSLDDLARPKDDPLFYDVVIYFAHRVPNNGNNAQSRQEMFVNTLGEYLENGGGVISFHHGVYRTSGKDSIQALLGAQATGSVPWDTINGQDVIYVGGEHFIGSHEITYNNHVAYENSSHSIPAGMYPAFNNTPDERYPQMDFINTNPGCELKALFESDYNNNGNNHLLSYLKYCPDWKSQIFVYQPGEYQPNALSGNNFQILLNAIYYLSGYRWDIVFKNNFD